MKKILLSSLIAAAAAVPAVAGVNNLNYQAVIKDGNGVMADKKVEMKFELLDKNQVVYSEEQTPTTNAAGLVVCQLGGEDGLASIEWGDLTLRVSIKLGANYEVISNEAISSVPTAIYAVKTADSDMIKEALENVIADNEETKSTLLGMSAEIARIDGLAADFENLGENLDNSFATVNADIEDLQGQVENLNNVSAVVRVNEENIELLTTEVEKLVSDNEETKSKLLNMGAEIAMIEGLTQDMENLDENLTLSFTSMNAELEEVKGQVENLNMVAAVVRENEAAIEEINTGMNNFQESLQMYFGAMEATTEELQGAVEGLVKDNEETKSTLLSYGAEIARIDGIANDFENLGENLDNLVNQMQESDKALEAQIENLNNVSAVVRVNEENIEALQEEVKNLNPEGISEIKEEVVKLIADNEETKGTLLSMNAEIARIDGIANDFENLGENLDNLVNQMQESDKSLEAQIENLNNVSAVVRVNEENIEALQEEIKALKAELEALKK